MYKPSLPTYYFTTATGITTGTEPIQNPVFTAQQTGRTMLPTTPSIRCTGMPLPPAAVNPLPHGPTLSTYLPSSLASPLHPHFHPYFDSPVPAWQIFPPALASSQPLITSRPATSGHLQMTALPTAALPLSAPTYPPATPILCKDGKVFRRTAPDEDYFLSAPIKNELINKIYDVWRSAEPFDRQCLAPLQNLGFRDKKILPKTLDRSKTPRIQKTSELGQQTLDLITLINLMMTPASSPPIDVQPDTLEALLKCIIVKIDSIRAKRGNRSSDDPWTMESEQIRADTRLAFVWLMARHPQLLKILDAVSEKKYTIYLQNCGLWKSISHIKEINEKQIRVSYQELVSKISFYKDLSSANPADAVSDSPTTVPLFPCKPKKNQRHASSSTSGSSLPRASMQEMRKSPGPGDPLHIPAGLSAEAIDPREAASSKRLREDIETEGYRQQKRSRTEEAAESNAPMGCTIENKTEPASAPDRLDFLNGPSPSDGATDHTGNDTSRTTELWQLQHEKQYADEDLDSFLQFGD